MYHSRNPFLEMLAANGDEEELQPQQGPPGLQQQHQAPAPRPGKVQLSNFWPQAPDAWFEMADITTERERLAHVDSAMGFNILRAFMDLVENPPVVDPYVQYIGLKERQVLAHQLTPVQKATKCLHVVAGSYQCGRRCWPPY